MTAEQLSMLQLQKVKHIFTEWSQTVASKPWPWTSVSTLLLCSYVVSAAYRTCRGCALPTGRLQSEPSTQRQVSSPLLGCISDLSVYISAVFLVTDGATRRWTKRCTSVTTMWSTSCGSARKCTIHLLLMTLSRLEEGPWARSSNSRTLVASPEKHDNLSPPRSWGPQRSILSIIY